MYLLCLMEYISGDFSLEKYVVFSGNTVKQIINKYTGMWNTGEYIEKENITIYGKTFKLPMSAGFYDAYYTMKTKSNFIIFSK